MPQGGRRLRELAEVRQVQQRRAAGRGRRRGLERAPLVHGQLDLPMRAERAQSLGEGCGLGAVPDAAGLRRRRQDG